MGTPLNQSLEALFSKMETFVSTKTVVGEPVTFGDVIIIPLVDVFFGVAAGSSETEKNAGSSEVRKNDGSGGGLGAKITPSAVLVVANGTVQLVNVKNQDSMNKLIDMVPGVMSKISSMFGKKDKDEQEDFAI